MFNTNVRNKSKSTRILDADFIDEIEKNAQKDNTNSYLKE